MATATKTRAKITRKKAPVKAEVVTTQATAQAEVTRCKQLVLHVGRAASPDTQEDQYGNVIQIGSAINGDQFNNILKTYFDVGYGIHTIKPLSVEAGGVNIYLFLIRSPNGSVKTYSEVDLKVRPSITSQTASSIDEGIGQQIDNGWTLELAQPMGTEKSGLNVLYLLVK